MKKTGRILVRFSAGLAVVLVAASILSFDGVDYRPYLREPYYAETTALLRASLATNSVVRGELAAGFGRARLTPTLNASEDDPAKGRFRSLPLAGYGQRNGRSARGVHDDLYVKAVALRVGGRLGVMIGADALIIPPEVTEAVLRGLEGDLKFDELIRTMALALANQ